MKLTVRIWTLDAPAALLQEIRRRIGIEPSEHFLYPHDASLGSCRWEFPHDHPDAKELNRLLATHPVPAKVHRFRQRTYTNKELAAAPLFVMSDEAFGTRVDMETTQFVPGSGTLTRGRRWDQAGPLMLRPAPLLKRRGKKRVFYIHEMAGREAWVFFADAADTLGGFSGCAFREVIDAGTGEQVDELKQLWVEPVLPAASPRTPFIPVPQHDGVGQTLHEALVYDPRVLDVARDFSHALDAWGGSPTNHLVVSQRVRQHFVANRLLKPGCFDPVHIPGVFDPPPDGG